MNIDPNSALEVVKEGSKFLTKIGEVWEKLLGPRLTRKQADAEAYADEKKLAMIRNNPDVEIVYVDGKMNARRRTLEALTGRAEMRLLNEATRQQKNLEAVLDIAAEDVADDKDVSDEPIDDDWLARLFEIIKNISDEQMQILWGKILAGEIKKPGSFSIRTLESIRNINKEEAEIFQKMLPFFLEYEGGVLLPSEAEILSENSVSYDDVLAMDDCCLMNSGGMANINFSIQRGKKTSFWTAERIILIEGKSEEKKTASIGAYFLTRAGIELFHILTCEGKREYVYKVAEKIKQSNQNLESVRVYKIQNREGSKIHYALPAEKEFTE